MWLQMSAGRTERRLIYPQGQSFPSCAFPMGPAAGCPVVHSKACSDRARWRKEAGGRKERGSFPRTCGAKGRALLTPCYSLWEPHTRAASRSAAARMREALLAPSLLRAVLSPWQPWRDDGARAGWARTGRGRRRGCRPS